MCENICREISLENLEALSKIYKLNWPRHIVIYSTLQTFLKRLEKTPDLKTLLKLYVLSDDWQKTGDFVAIVRFTKGYF